MKPASALIAALPVLRGSCISPLCQECCQAAAEAAQPPGAQPAPAPQ